MSQLLWAWQEWCLPLQPSVCLANTLWDIWRLLFSSCFNPWTSTRFMLSDLREGEALSTGCPYNIKGL